MDQTDRKAAGGEGGSLLGLWFGLDRRVRPLPYAASGFGLMALKYGVEAAAIRQWTGAFLSPLDFLNPLLSSRQALFAPGSEWLGWALVAWAIPFLWISMSMSVRRAADAGWSPWTGLVVLVPLLNILFMGLMCAVPSSPTLTWSGAGRHSTRDDGVRSALLAVLASSVIGLGALGVGVYAAGTYGASLFLGAPVLMGAASGYIHNRAHSRGWGSTLGVAFLAIGVPGLALLLFALEGAICLAMASVIAIPAALLGGCIGKAIADASPRPARGVVVPVLCLPVLAGTESLRPLADVREVCSSVEIDAPPDRVWPHVVSFPPLPEPEEWYFRLGIAYPVGARIAGRGVGAVRHCDFSTGSFTEPITAWEPPLRLAFDVTEQPEPMFELTPYHAIHPPHLHGTMRSQRGEFLLVALPGGRTRLEGRTWVSLELYPQAYWTLWSDAIVRRIHGRVLRHVKAMAEGGYGARRNR